MTLLSALSRRACIFVSVIAVVITPHAASAADPTVARYAGVLRSFNPALSAAQSQDIATHVLLMSSYYSLDPRLLVAIVSVESGWRNGAISPSGARGLGQLMPSTANVLGVLATDAYENLDGTARYLRRMVRATTAADVEERFRLALASYNAGPEAVARFGGIPPFAETQAYVAKVMALWHNLKSLLPSIGDTAALIARRTVPAVVAAGRPKQKPYRIVFRPFEAAVPIGSVAEFTALDAWSVQEYLAYTASLPTPAPKKTFARWFTRAFGVAKR